MESMLSGGWINSQGACLEHDVATTLDMDVYVYSDGRLILVEQKEGMRDGCVGGVGGQRGL